MEALIVLQDCNIGGEYYRYFWYYADDKTRHCEITGTWHLSTEKGVDQLKEGQEIKLSNGYRFQVIAHHCSPFYKILERVHD
jgi:hypothetical protein